MPSDPNANKKDARNSELDADDLNLFLGLRWRIFLGVLSRTSTSLDNLRRIVSEKRRKYGSLRREWLVDPHNSNDYLRNTKNLSVENPLSQDPESTWSQYFNVNTVMKAIETDLDALTSESEDKTISLDFWRPSIKRILTVWSLSHPSVGYCKGMLEILFPLLHVLQKDVERLASIRINRHYGDIFDDDFNQIHSSSNMGNPFDSEDFLFSIPSSTDDPLNIDEQKFLLLSSPPTFSQEEFLVAAKGCDPYGAEGDLGSLLSVKYLEHDAYCLFDSLLETSLICKVTLSQLFQGLSFHHKAEDGSLSSVPTVCSSVYSLLKQSDPLLHDHLTNLGLESQLFSLRWMRLLFSREFDLPKLIDLWDGMFFEARARFVSGSEPNLRIVMAEAIAVAMLKCVRSPLLACDDFAGCLQRLLRLPTDLNVHKLITVAREVSLPTVSFSSPSPSPSPPLPNVAKAASSVRKELFPLSSPSKNQVMATDKKVDPKEKFSVKTLNRSKEFNTNNGSENNNNNIDVCVPSFQLSVKENSWEETWKNSVQVLDKLQPTSKSNSKLFHASERVEKNIVLKKKQASMVGLVYPHDLKFDPFLQTSSDSSITNISGNRRSKRVFPSTDHHSIDSRASPEKLPQDAFISNQNLPVKSSLSSPTSSSSSFSNEDIFATALRWKRKLLESSSLNMFESSKLPESHYCSNCVHNQTFRKQSLVSVRRLQCESSSDRRGWIEENIGSTLKEDELEILVSEHSSMHARSVSVHVRVNSILGERDASTTNLPGLGFEEDGEGEGEEEKISIMDQSS